jgi:hypothetical protein
MISELKFWCFLINYINWIYIVTDCYLGGKQETQKVKIKI